MHTKSRQELYRSFIDLIRTEVQVERNAVNRRMLSVFFWCFLLPAIVSAALLILMNLGAVPRGMRALLDWIILVFPVSYSIYFLSSEVLREVPAAFRRGGIATTLGQALKEGDWREKVSGNMRKALPDARPADWSWIASSFKADLEALQYRTRYLTALAGAVFFLIMQGIDSLGDDPTPVVWTKDPVLGWIESSGNDLGQFVGLGLFLVLLYLSGSQTYHSLQRYLRCVELLILEDQSQR